MFNIKCVKNKNENFDHTLAAMLLSTPHVDCHHHAMIDAYAALCDDQLSHFCLSVRHNVHRTETATLILQEAQLPHRNRASAVHVYLGSVTDRAMHRTPQNRIGCYADAL